MPVSWFAPFEEAARGRRLEAHLLGPDPDPHLLRRAAQGARLDPGDGAVGQRHGVAAGDLRVEQVADAQEAGDERRVRPLVELGRRADLLDPALVHHGDPVGHRHRLFLVVRDVDEGDVDLGLDALQLQLHLLAQLQVERAQRLVQQQHARMVDQGAGERDALRLAARQLRRLALLEALQLDQLEHLGNALGDLGLRHLALAQPERHVVLDRHVREQRVVLEDRVDLALVRREAGHVLLAQVHGAAGRLLEPADHAQRRGLAASGGAEQRDEAAPLEGEREIVDGFDLSERFGYPLEADIGLIHSVSRGSWHVNGGRRVYNGTGAPRSPLGHGWDADGRRMVRRAASPAAPSGRAGGSRPRPRRRCGGRAGPPP